MASDLEGRYVLDRLGLVAGFQDAGAPRCGSAASTWLPPGSTSRPSELISAVNRRLEAAQADVTPTLAIVRTHLMRLWNGNANAP